MKSVIVAAISAFAAGVQAAVQGFDISHYQSSVDFKAAYNSGARFVIIKVSFSRFLFSPPPPLSLSLTIIYILP